MNKYNKISVGDVHFEISGDYSILDSFGDDTNKMSKVLHKKDTSIFGKRIKDTHINDIAPTPIQSIAIPALLSNKNIIVRAPTGMGKTHAFLYPLVKKLSNNAIDTLILVPVKELAEQVKREAEKLIDVFYGESNEQLDLSKSSITDLYKNNYYIMQKMTNVHLNRKYTVKTLYGGIYKNTKINNASILVSCTGKLVDFLKRNLIDLSQCRHVILDEADKMVDMGFKEDIDEIFKYLNKDIQIGCFSATYNRNMYKLVEKLIDRNGANNVYSEILVTNEVVTNIKQSFIKTQNKFKKLLTLLDQLDLETSWALNKKSDKVIIFVERKKDVVALKEKLSSVKNNSFFIDILHGDLEQSFREINLKRFQLNSNILIATSVAARGIDVKDVRMVINYDIPKDIKDYIHRIGRTGREGKKGEAISLYEDEYKLKDDFIRELLNVLEESENEKPREFVDVLERKKRKSPKKEEIKKKEPEQFKEKEDSDADCPTDEW